MSLVGNFAGLTVLRATRPSTKKSPWPEPASELYRSSDCRLSAKLVPTFADREFHVVSVTDPYGRNLGFIDRSRYFFILIAPQSYPRGWVDPVPGPLLLRKSCSAGNRTRASGSVARNSDHWTKEAVYFLLHNIYKFSSYLTRNTTYLRSATRNSDHQTTETVYFLLHNIFNSVRTSQETQYISVV
jgi:hypothetical protein